MIKNPVLDILFLFFLCINIFIPFKANANFLNNEQLREESGVSIFLSNHIHSRIFNKFFSFFTYDFSKFRNSSFIPASVISSNSKALTEQSDDEKNNEFSFDLIWKPSDEVSAENNIDGVQHNDWLIGITWGGLTFVFIFVLSEFLIGAWGLIETFYFLWT